MAVVTFYEKPGCKGNLRQKTLLAAAGHTVRAKSLKTEPWTAERLLQFLGALPVAEWFNPAAPDIKSGQIVPENLGFEDALHLLLSNPLLIRRPLMEVDDERMVGFDVARVDAWLGLNGIELPEGNIDACVHGPEGHGSCGSHAHEHEEAENAGCGTH
jgi:nitrogenase-associated protein